MMTFLIMVGNERQSAGPLSDHALHMHYHDFPRVQHPQVKASPEIPEGENGFLLALGAQPKSAPISQEVCEALAKEVLEKTQTGGGPEVTTVYFSL